MILLDHYFHLINCADLESENHIFRNTSFSTYKIDFQMSLRFIGNQDFVSNGKFLWEILTQLKNLGVGRYVTVSRRDLS